MTLDLLPSGVHIHSSQPLALRISKGHAVVSEPLIYPDFYVSAKELREAGLSVSSFEDACPAQVTQEGLAWDPRWVIFSYLKDKGTPFLDIPEGFLRKVFSREVPWDLSCPVLRGPSTLVGQVIAQYGIRTGACPSYHGSYNPTRAMLSNSLSDLLCSVHKARLRDFRDRGDTLLDLAMEHQQWRLAEDLWKLGVRWSSSSVEQGKPLEALIIGSAGLQESLSLDGVIDIRKGFESDDRIAWLTKWMDRWNEQEVALPVEPALLWRSRRARESNWEEGVGIRDTPQSLWCTMILAQRGPAVQKMATSPDHIVAVMDIWVGFWSSHGVDVFQVPIQRSLGAPPANIRDFWATSLNIDPWMEHLQCVSQQCLLSKMTPTPTSTSRSAPRL